MWNLCLVTVRLCCSLFPAFAAPGWTQQSSARTFFFFFFYHPSHQQHEACAASPAPAIDLPGTTADAWKVPSNIFWAAAGWVGAQEREEATVEMKGTDCREPGHTFWENTVHESRFYCRQDLGLNFCSVASWVTLGSFWASDVIFVMDLTLK